MSSAGGAGPGRIAQGRCSMLELLASKGARAVLRGGGAGDSSSLPDRGRASAVAEPTGQGQPAGDGQTLVYIHFVWVPDEDLDIQFALEDLVGDAGEVR